jgi:dTDP-4-amino-4,6-dideoxygalactose transaminase
MISISKVDLGPEVENEVLEVLRSGIIAQGPKVAQLEAEFAAMIGARHVVAVNNGTTALIAALEVLDLKPGDEVITSPFTFVATLNAILQAGATARFADISRTDFNVRADSVSRLVNDRTKVLMPVHLYGQTADMDALTPIVANHNLRLVEDAAQSHGATQNKKSAGTWGIGCFSLYATKNLTSGEGGLISTDDDVVADRLRLLRNQGMRQRYQYEMSGNNYRMTDVQAAICLPQLRRYSSVVERRRRNAEMLNNELSSVPWLSVPTPQPNRDHVWHQYTVLVDEDAPVKRDELIEHLAAKGVGSGVYYPKLVHDYQCYVSDSRVVVDPTPEAASVVAHCLSLPVHQGLTADDIFTIAQAIKGAKK